MEGAWIDFTVVPLAELSATLDGNDLLVTTTSRVQRSDGFTLRAGPFEQRLQLERNQPLPTRISLKTPSNESAEILDLSLRSGDAVERRELGLRTVRAVRALALWLFHPRTDCWSSCLVLNGAHKYAEWIRPETDEVVAVFGQANLARLRLRPARRVNDLWPLSVHQDHRRPTPR